MSVAQARNHGLRARHARIAALWLGLQLAVCATAHAQDDPRPLARFEFAEPHMGTGARIVLYAPDAAAAAHAAAAGFARIRELDAVLSDYRDDSELNRLVARAGQGPVAVGEDLFVVLWAAQSLARRSGGAFDAARGAVTRLWRQARRLDEAPDPDRLRAAVDAGDWRDLSLDAATRTAILRRPGMRLDLGGIAKGHAAEQALQALRQLGIDRALVALGGDIAVGAPPPDAPGWRIEVAPLDVPGAPPPTSLLVRDAAVSTAGDAEQWMEIDGVRLSHVIDARSGRPLDFRSSTTVVAPRGLQADGLDTAASVLGPEAGLRLVDAVPGAAALMLRQTADGRVLRATSARWANWTLSAAAAASETSP